MVLALELQAYSATRVTETLLRHEGSDLHLWFGCAMKRDEADGRCYRAEACQCAADSQRDAVAVRYTR